MITWKTPAPSFRSELVVVEKEEEEEEEEHAFVCWLQAHLVENDGVINTNLRE